MIEKTVIPDDREASVPLATQPLVLVAEDNKTSNEMLCGYLENKGYRTAAAMNGEEVVALAGEQRPDLILMDIQMPGINGLDAIRRIRSFAPPDNAVPIIALTALAMPGDKERCLAAGAHEYLSKPVRLKELVRMIAALLSS